MSGIVYMAWRYVARHRFKTAILVLSLALIVFIPVGLRVLVAQSERELTARAERTPLVIGAKGSPLELVLSSLYFSLDAPQTLRFDAVDRVADTGLATPIPLSVRHRSRSDPIVATTLDYFGFRGLRIAEGRLLTRLGDCVVGARVARRRGLGPGQSVISSPENVFDLTGVYPLKMRVTGVFAPTGGPDDEVIFIDVKTAWIIEGRAHGHEDLERDTLLGRDGDRLTANAAVVEHNEVTDANVGSFHFHGDQAAFPITAIVAVAPDRKSADLLMGRFEGPDERLQIVRPDLVVDTLIDTVFVVQRFVVAALAIVALATLATAALVVMLSLRLRRREIETMVRIGGARSTIGSILALEICSVVAAAVTLAAALTWLTSLFGAELVRTLITG